LFQFPFGGATLTGGVPSQGGSRFRGYCNKYHTISRGNCQPSTSSTPLTKRKIDDTISIHRLQVTMKADQYSRHESIKVKARANYLCEFCGSDQMVQAHAPDGNHSDWRKGICLCAGHHADQHPNIPRNLFFTKMQQPYWPNVSARAIATELGCHNRTVIRAAKKLEIAISTPISDNDRGRLKELIKSREHYSCHHRRQGSPLAVEVQLSPELECERCHHKWVPRQKDVRMCPKCKSPWWDRPKRKVNSNDHTT